MRIVGMGHSIGDHFSRCGQLILGDHVDRGSILNPSRVLLFNQKLSPLYISYRMLG